MKSSECGKTAFSSCAIAAIATDTYIGLIYSDINYISPLNAYITIDQSYSISVLLGSEIRKSRMLKIGSLDFLKSEVLTSENRKSGKIIFHYLL